MSHKEIEEVPVKGKHPEFKRPYSWKGYKRIGKCKEGCGLCCEMGLSYQWTKRGVRATCHNMKAFGTKICPSYIPRTRKCDCHEKNKPKMCKDFPENPSQLKAFNDLCKTHGIKERCSYKFVRVKR